MNAGEESRCNCTALRKASRRISRLYDDALEPSGLKTTQRAILAQIARSGPTSVGVLAEALVMDAGALAHTLKPLERDGLVTIGIDPDDRRSKRIALTPLGHERLSVSDAFWRRAQDGFEAALGQLPSEQLREAMRLLTTGEFAIAFAEGMAASGSPKS